MKPVSSFVLDGEKADGDNKADDDALLQRQQPF